MTCFESLSVRCMLLNWLFSLQRVKGYGCSRLQSLDARVPVKYDLWRRHHSMQYRPGTRRRPCFHSRVESSNLLLGINVSFGIVRHMYRQHACLLNQSSMGRTVRLVQHLHRSYTGMHDLGCRQAPAKACVRLGADDVFHCPHILLQQNTRWYS